MPHVLVRSAPHAFCVLDFWVCLHFVACAFDRCLPCVPCPLHAWVRTGFWVHGSPLPFYDYTVAFCSSTYLLPRCRFAHTFTHAHGSLVATGYACLHVLLSPHHLYRDPRTCHLGCLLLLATCAHHYCRATAAYHLVLPPHVYLCLPAIYTCWIWLSDSTAVARFLQFTCRWVRSTHGLPPACGSWLHLWIFFVLVCTFWICSYTAGCCACYLPGFALRTWVRLRS